MNKKREIDKGCEITGIDKAWERKGNKLIKKIKTGQRNKYDRMGDNRDGQSTGRKTEGK